MTKKYVYALQVKDGKCFVLFTRSVEVLNVNTCQKEDEMELETRWFYSTNPDKTELYYWLNNKNISVINTENLSKKSINVPLSSDIVSFTVCSEFIYISCEEKKISVADKNGKIIKTFESSNKYFKKLVYNPESKILAGLPYLDGIVECWDTVSGKKIRGNGPYMDAHCGIAWLNSTVLLTFKIEGILRFWDITTWKCIKSVNVSIYENIYGIRVSPCKHYIILEHLHSLSFIKSDSGEIVYTYTSGKMFTSVNFSPDGDFVAVGTEDSIQLLYFNVSFAPPIHIGKLKIKGIFKNVELTVSDARIDIVWPGLNDRTALLHITPKSTFEIDSPLQFRLCSNDFSTINHSSSKKRSYEEIDNTGTVCIAESEKAARDWLEALEAVRWNLIVASGETRTNAQIMNNYRFDLLQLINSQNRGKGIVPGRTVPKDAMKLIRFYTMEQQVI